MKILITIIIIIIIVITGHGNDNCRRSLVKNNSLITFVDYLFDEALIGSPMIIYTLPKSSADDLRNFSCHSQPTLGPLLNSCFFLISLLFPVCFLLNYGCLLVDSGQFLDESIRFDIFFNMIIQIHLNFYDICTYFIHSWLYINILLGTHFYTLSF